ncbi:hypothetical protein NMG60_11005435 [Bertholletia excelsa]
MKLSFSISSKPSSKQHPDLKPSHKFNSDEQHSSATASSNKEYVTEFDASKTLTQQPKKFVIPPKPNEWRPYKKMKNLDLPLRPSEAPDLRFEVESTPAAEDGPDISYGLNLRNSDAASNADSKNVESAPLDTVMLQKLRDDLNRLPEDIGEDEYADTPVEGFGAALLAGYGWHEGRGIGRNAKEDVKVVEYKRRTAKEGLGFFGDMPGSNVNNGTNGSKKKEEQRRRGEEEVRFSAGKDVRIVGGRDVGLKGRIVKVVGGDDSVIVKLLRSEDEVKVRVRDVAELGSVEEERCLRKLKELKIRRSKDENDSSIRQSGRETKEEGVGERRKDCKRSREGERRDEQRDELRNTNQVPWLTSHIRVRIISKKLEGGRLYLKKGEVVDVVGPTTCDISMDESRELIQGVDQDLLETALPRRGGAVVVLYGKHKGVYGSLVERNMQNETGVVRDADTHALLNVRLEQIAEYIGDPSYIGY